MHCLSTAELTPAEVRVSGIDQPLRSGLRNMSKAWEQHEFMLDRRGSACTSARPESTGASVKRAGQQVVSATFVTPYPPGFPVLMPGQVFSQEILAFMPDLDTPEIHGYEPQAGYRVCTSKAI